MSKIIMLTDSNFRETIGNSKNPVLVDFWADWCVPCKAIAPMIDKIAKEYDGKLIVAKFDVDSNSVIPGSLGIRSIPTLIIFSEGVEVERIIGSVQAEELEKKIKKLLK